MERLRMGSEEMDYVLGGGLPMDTICLVTGAPGTGKTVLALQALFANCSPDCRGLYLTTLSEPFYKLIRFVQSFTFFDEAKMLAGITFHDLGADMSERGLEALPSIAADLIKQVQPRIIVIDSFKALHDLALSEHDFRRILYQLAGLLTGYACTTLLLGEYDFATQEQQPEFAVADSIIDLINKQAGVRDERYLRVAKLRGSGYASGEHAFRITADGFKAFPRLVTPSTPQGYALETDRLSTGVSGLDAMLGGGILRGSTTLVTGATGTGKTCLGLSFLAAGAAAGEEGLHLSFQENPTFLVRTANALKLPIQNPLIEYWYRSPIELIVDEVVAEIRRRIEDRPIKRVVVDALGDLEAACWDKVRFRHYIYALTQLAMVLNISLLVINEVANFNNEGLITSENISYLSDNIIYLWYTDREALARRILVLKERGSNHDDASHCLRLAEGKGIVVE